MEKLAIVILNYNGKKHLQTFLPSVISHSLSYPIYIADNGSTDDSILFLKAYFPEVNLISFPQNSGFSTGYNLALKQIEAEYYVLLNSDVEISAGWVEPILELMENDNKIGACQPKIKSYINRDYFEYAGAAGGYVDKYGFPFCRGRIFTTVEIDTGQYDDIKEIFWASGACMFVRADIFHQLDGLDDDFFAHMEEIDLCWRMQNNGFKIMYCGYSTVYHLGGGTLPKTHPKKTFLNFRNGILLLYKNLPSQKIFTTLFIRLSLDGVAAIKFLFSETVNDFFAVLKAHFSFYWDIIKWTRNRRKARKSIKEDNAYKLFPKSIVKEYFWNKNKTYKQLIDN